MPKILITGTAGFIGFHLVKELIKEGWDIVGLDNINDYYYMNLKYARLKESGIQKGKIEYNKFIVSEKNDKYRFIKLNLEDKKNILNLFRNEKFEYVVNLTAQAGVRYSLLNPYAYLDSNIYGFLNILEGSRHCTVKHLIYASSSSVYGANKKIPFSEEDRVDHPISLYAATKRSNELMAYTYSQLYGIPTTGLRFFTIYGPWGRPDMAYFRFTNNILKGEPIKVFNYGNMKRDFTFIDDVIECLYRLIFLIANQENEWQSDCTEFQNSIAPYKIYNIGNDNPIGLTELIEIIEFNTNKNAIKEFVELQYGDVIETWAEGDSFLDHFGL